MWVQSARHLHNLGTKIVHVPVIRTPPEKLSRWVAWVVAQLAVGSGMALGVTWRTFGNGQKGCSLAGTRSSVLTRRARSFSTLRVNPPPLLGIPQ